MKTIIIQNCTDYKDSMFKVFVNGEKHAAQKFSYKFQVADDKPFNLKVKYFWDGSPVYAFEPKDDMILQVMQNLRMMNLHQILISATMIIALAAMLIFKNSFFVLVGYLPWLFVMTFHFIVRRKKYFIIREVNYIIREVNNEIEDEND